MIVHQWKRKWYILCLLFGTGAITLECIADHHAGLGMTLMAEGDHHAAASEQVHLSSISGQSGMLLAGLFILFWAVSFANEESGYQSIPIIVLIIYLGFFGLTV